MTADDKANDAWRAFEEGRFADAERLWSALIASSIREDERDAYRSKYAYVLVALDRFDEARAIYQELFDRYGIHKYLHQIGMVEREAGNLGGAIAALSREAELLSEDDPLSKAANLYEQALIHHLLGKHPEARQLCEDCVNTAHVSGDATMLGCAHRLRGDLLARSDRVQARTHYMMAIGFFERAEDPRGVLEVEARIASLSPDS